MNRERVQMLRNVIAGIPEERIDLDTFKRGGQTARDCSTVACIGGWAAFYPSFIKQGLGIIENYQPTYRGRIGTAACGLFFDVPARVFSIRGPREHGTHKEIALQRLDKLLKARTTTTTK